jgi:HPt (histidine-containing phosphotransfer) domain-containing protein
VREHELLAAIEAVVPGLCVASAVAALPALLPASLISGNTEPFEIAALVGSVNGSHCTLAGLLEDCRDGDFPELFEQLSTALDANELSKVQRAAHAIKGVIGVFHAPAAYAAAKQIEESARLGNAGELRQQADELRRAVSELLTSLERFVSASPLLSRAA